MNRPQAATVGSLMRGVLPHHTYHEGRIAILKRAGDVRYSE